MALFAYDPTDATIVVAQTATGAFTNTIQLIGASGKDMARAAAVSWYLSKSSDGSDIATDSTDVTSLAIGTDGLAIEENANVAGKFICESDGDIDIAIVIPSAKVVYLVLIMPTGRLVISDAMTYAM